MIKTPEYQKAIVEARAILINCARNRKMIPYSSLCEQITAMRFDPHTEIGHLLGDLSRESDVANEGMLSVLAVHKDGDLMPGGGFFELGKELGHDTSDRERFWIEQYKKVINYWKQR